jgi:UPF0271 protein
MPAIDINCDLGEGIGNDEAIMPFISSANIACGFHAGNDEIMQETVALCIKYNLTIGAHPSFRDKENFGRMNMDLPVDEIYSLVLEQVQSLSAIVNSLGQKLHYIKPHGALYNMAAKDISIANAIAKAAKDFDEKILLYGLPGGAMEKAAAVNQIKFIGEAFADRTYQPDGSLTPRTQPGSLIEDEEESIRQVFQIINNKTVTCVTGEIIPLKAETICIHGDGKHIVKFARALFTHLKKSGVIIQSPK